jgi:hypothetical protein
MKKKETSIEKEVEKTLQSFDRLQPLAHNPYFYTRLKARLKEVKQRKAGWRPVLILRPVLVVLLALVNVYAAVLIWDNGNDTQTDREAYVSALASEYALEQNIEDPFAINEQD